MGLTVSWLVEGRIGEVRAFGEVTLEEVLETDQTIHRMLNDKSPDTVMVHFIVDFLEVEKFSIPVQKMSQALTHLKHPSLGWKVLATNNMLIRSSGWLISQVVKVRFRAFTNLQDAATFLIEQDTTLRPFAHILAEREKFNDPV